MSKFNKSSIGSRVGEWAEYSYNIGTGCLNDCKYCYARDIALSNGMIPDKSRWPHELVNPQKADIHETVSDMVMFPTMHDITDTYLPSYMKTLHNIIDAGNRVLIVTKPRMPSILSLCDSFSDSKDKILFRFTIGSMNEAVSRFWEPNAPKPKERVSALRYAFASGYQTSVSAEPMLEGYRQAIALYEELEPHVTDTIWFGKMDNIDQRVDLTVPANKSASQFIKDFQSDDNLRRLYDALKDRSKVRWKKSLRQVIGI